MLGLAALVLLGPFDLAQRTAVHEARALGRPVTIGTLRVGFGARVTVALADLVIGNAPDDGPQPLLKLGRVDAEIAPWSLVGWLLLGHGPTLRHLSVADVEIALDHGADGRPNWHFGADRPKDDPRPGFPTLLDARLRDIVIGIHTSSGKQLRIRLDEASLAATGSDQPVTLAATGSYNGFPIRLEAPLGSFDQLHRAGAPFDARVDMVSGETQLDFTGTLTEPLAADGIAGQLTITAPSLDRLLEIAGVAGRAAMPLTLTGALSRDDDLWKLTDAKGTLSAEPFRLSARLQEGPRHAPDAFTLDAGFTALDLAQLGGQDQSGDTLLRIDDAPGTILEGHITAGRITDGALQADDVDLKVKLAPGSFSLDPLALRFAGGTGRLELSISNTTGDAAALRVDGSLAGADPAQLSRLLGLGSLPITGTVDLRADAAGTAVKARDLGRGASGALVLAMQGGTIARTLVEAAATDVRLLFGKAEGAARVHCLLGVIDLKGGIGRMAPLRLRTSDGTLIGDGTLDLKRNTIDVTFATEAATTSGFALDVPVRLSGPIQDPHVLPSVTRPSPGGDLGGLPPALREFARGNACASG